MKYITEMTVKKRCDSLGWVYNITTYDESGEKELAGKVSDRLSEDVFDEIMRGFDFEFETPMHIPFFIEHKLSA